MLSKHSEQPRHRSRWHTCSHVLTRARARQWSVAHIGGGGATGGDGGSVLPPPHTNPPAWLSLSQSAVCHPSLPSICTQLPIGGDSACGATNAFVVVDGV